MDLDNYEDNFEYKEVSGALDRLENLIEASKINLLSRKVSVDKDEILEVIQEIRFNLPSEVRQSSMIVEERQRILEDAIKEADTIRKGAYANREDMVKQENVTQYAKDKAESMISDAQENAINIQFGAIDYADSICEKLEKMASSTLEKMYNQLKKFDEYANNILDEIETNKKELEKMRLQLQELGE